MMRKGIWFLLLLCVGCSTFLQSCRNDEQLADLPPVPDQSFVEQFDTMQNAHQRGWRWANRSQPIGTTGWMQVPEPAGNMAAFSSRGTNRGAAYANYLSTSGTDNGTISNWLISPSLILKNGDKIVFYTKAQMDAAVRPNRDYRTRLQVCFNPTDDDIEVGDGDKPGKFSTVLLDINEAEAENVEGAAPPTSYPSNWTRFEATIKGLNKAQKSRFAFRYYLHNAGSNGAGLGVGIDSVTFVSSR